MTKPTKAKRFLEDVTDMMLNMGRIQGVDNAGGCFDHHTDCGVIGLNIYRFIRRRKVRPNGAGTRYGSVRRHAGISFGVYVKLKSAHIKAR